MINCKEISENIREKLKISNRVGLAIVQIGNDAGSNFYVRNKIKDCEELNIRYKLIKQEKATNLEMINLIKKLNNDNSISGIIVQLPLPENLDPKMAISAIDFKKDVDGFKENSPYLPCTPKGILTILHSCCEDLTGRKVTLIGRGETVGKPLRDLLIKENVTLTICHSKTKEEDLHSAIQNADIIISCVGKPALITGELVHEGQIIIDVGISRINGKQVGDVSKEVWNIANCTPWVNGVGLMTRTSLLQNLVYSAEIQ